jgi:hypothetical protein
MADNVFDMERGPTIETLARLLDGIDECKRLGFVKVDEGVLHLTVSGLGFLLRVRARDVTSVAEAFAAGYDCAKEDG